MAENNKSYRIRTAPGFDANITIGIDHTYSAFNILSLKINSDGLYKVHNSNYGVVVGRVLANGGFGVPNAKLSLFIDADNSDEVAVSSLYSYGSVDDRNDDNIRYNLLPDQNVNDCHKAVGTFPNKRYVLDNNSVLEVYEKYYKFTTRTNNAGDYMIMGVPTGEYTLHMDLDISDCGALSQRPRDFIYKGYTVEQFENANQFKDNDELSSLSQIFSQDKTITVIPFWGAGDDGETIGITRADVDIPFKFETTCVFLGSVVADNNSNGVGKKCVPTDSMGSMEDLTTGEGRIEMIRKTADGSVEEFQIKGNELINQNGVWCYQIPMNLDYVVTDEFGNMVPTDDSSKGIPTRARVRFRCSVHESEEAVSNYYLAKMLIPHNPETADEVDYDFGTSTKDCSYRDLMWNNVYSVKAFIPRVQKTKRWKNERFTGIKNCNFYGSNNPIPYNNMRVKMPFMFTVICAFLKAFIKIVSFINRILITLASFKVWVGFNKRKTFGNGIIVLAEGLCPDLDGWYFAPVQGNKKKKTMDRMLSTTIDRIKSESSDDEDVDSTSIDSEEKSDICVTTDVSYLISCVEMNLAQEYRVIKFDFYNDWINGVLYFPRWMRQLRKKISFAGFTLRKSKVIGCTDNNSNIVGSRYYTQQCVLPYRASSTGLSVRATSEKHFNRNLQREQVIGRKEGLVNTFINQKDQYVYYFKPAVFKRSGKRVLLFASDLVLLGSLNDCDKNGIPQFFKYLVGTTYVMPTNLALTNMDSSAYRFTNSGRTKCSGRYPSSSMADEILLGDNSFKGENEYDNLQYESVDDVVPVTEAAGVSWNYTGPDQGSPTKDASYSPGGHFLGMSCRSSIVNQKSCVNLSRICELGATMSQRIEIPKGVSEDKSTLEYLNIVPNGVVSGDELVDGGFRSMFATLNKKKLIADTVNGETGYNEYRFSYSRPLNFDGALLAYSSPVRNSYNTNRREYVMKKLDEAAELGMDISGIESGDTISRLNESSDGSYIKFRFGVNSYKEIGAKFLKNNSGDNYLPQYENSFYFYFGLRGGSTAIDEFNKQFFADCNRGLIDTAVPEVNLSVIKNENSDCDGLADVKFTFKNLSAPYFVSFIGESNKKEAGSIAENTAVVSDVKYDSYTVTIKDSLGRSYSASISIGIDGFTFDLGKVNTVDFKRRVIGESPEEVVSNTVSALLKSDDIGGYIEFLNGAIMYGGTVIEEFTKGDYCLVVSSNGRYVSSNKSFTAFGGKKIDTTAYSKAFVNGIRMCIWDSRTDKYSLFVGKKCGDSEVYSHIGDAKVFGMDKYSFYIGNKQITWEAYLNRLKPSWWEQIDTNPFVDTISTDNYASSVLRLATFKQGNREAGEDLCVRYMDNNGVSGPMVIMGQGEKGLGVIKTKGQYGDDIIYGDTNYVLNGYSISVDEAINQTVGIDALLKRHPYTVIPLTEDGVPICGAHAFTEKKYIHSGDIIGVSFPETGWTVNTGAALPYVSLSQENMVDIETVYDGARVMAIFNNGVVCYPYYNITLNALCFNVTDEDVPEFVSEQTLRNISFKFYIGLTVPLIIRPFSVTVTGAESLVLKEEENNSGSLERSVDFSSSFTPTSVKIKQRGGITYLEQIKIKLGNIVIDGREYNLTDFSGGETTGTDLDMTRLITKDITSAGLTSIENTSITVKNAVKDGYGVEKGLYEASVETGSPLFDRIEPYWQNSGGNVLALSGGGEFTLKNGEWIDADGGKIQYFFRGCFDLVENQQPYYYKLVHENGIQWQDADGTWKPFSKIILWLSEGTVFYVGINESRYVYFNNGTTPLEEPLRENYNVLDVIKSIDEDSGLPYISEDSYFGLIKEVEVTDQLMREKPYLPTIEYDKTIYYKIRGVYTKDGSTIERNYPIFIMKDDFPLVWVWYSSEFEEMASRKKAQMVEQFPNERWGSSSASRGVEIPPTATPELEGMLFLVTCTGSLTAPDYEEEPQQTVYFNYNVTYKSVWQVS